MHEFIFSGIYLRHYPIFDRKNDYKNKIKNRFLKSKTRFRFSKRKPDFRFSINIPTPDLFRELTNVPSKLCTCVHVHTVHRMSAHKKTWSTHKFSFKICFLHIFHTRLFQIQMSAGKMLHTKNVVCTQALKNQREHWSSLYQTSDFGSLVKTVAHANTTIIRNVYG